jgi:hypothetical protein
MLWVRPPLRERSTTLFDKVCEWLAASRWFSPGPPVSSNNKTDRHYILEILLKVALTTIQPTNQHLLIKLLNNNTTICAFCISIYNKLKQQWFIYLWYAKYLIGHVVLLNYIKISFLDWSKPYIARFDQTLWSSRNLARKVDNWCTIAVKYPNIDRGKLSDIRIKSNILIGQCIFMNQSQLWPRYI